MNDLIIYTDGGCRNNPGLGGWAYLIEYREFRFTESGIKEYTTNNEMELTAIYKALDKVMSLTEPPTSIIVRSDSNYCINTLTNWVYNWIKNDTINERPNHKLILDILSLITRIKKLCLLKFEKVKGHSGEEGNEFVDKLLNKAMDEYDPSEEVSDSVRLILLKLSKLSEKDKNYIRSHI